jgi:hypothetical protein
VSRADFTIAVRDTDAGVWVTLRGNQTGTTVQRCIQTRNFLLVLFAIGRMWLQGAARLASRPSPSPESQR